MKDSIKYDIIISISIVITLVGLLAGTILYNIVISETEEQFNKYKNTRTTDFARSLAIHLWNFDDQAIEFACVTLLKSSDIDAVRVRDEKNRIVFESGELTIPGINNRLNEIQYQGNIIGSFEIVFSEYTLSETRKNIVTSIFVIVIPIVSITILAMIFLITSIIVKPVKELQSGVAIVGKGNLDYKVGTDAKDEIGQLSRAFDEMITNLKIVTASRDELNREIAERKQAVSRMEAALEELKQHRDQLEEMVEKRTRELKDANVNLESEIVEHKKAEKELRKYRGNLENLVEKRTTQLEEVNNELKEFAYIVSHDLKAPLRAINQLSYWLSIDYDDVIDEKGKEQLALLGSRVKRMDSLIDGILQYSRVGKVSEKEETIYFTNLVKDVIASLVIPENIKINIDNTLPKYVGDETRFTEVFQNLISNSIKFLDKSNGKINIGCSDEGKYWKFRVEDNGPGIEQKYFDKVFQIFQTLKPRDELEGTGVGLALVKKIISIYKGEIWLESKVGEGLTVFFTLPKGDVDTESQDSN